MQNATKTERSFLQLPYRRPHIVCSLKSLNLTIFSKFKIHRNNITTTSSSKAHWRLGMKNDMHFCECSSKNTFSMKITLTKSQLKNRPIWTELWFVNHKSFTCLN